MRSYRLYLIPVLVLLAGLLSHCAVDPEDDILAPTSDISTGTHPIHGWLWAFDAETASCRVFHTQDRKAWASFRPFH